MTLSAVQLDQFILDDEPVDVFNGVRIEKDAQGIGHPLELGPRRQHRIGVKSPVRRICASASSALFSTPGKFAGSASIASRCTRGSVFPVPRLRRFWRRGSPLTAGRNHYWSRQTLGFIRAEKQFREWSIREPTCHHESTEKCL